MWKCTSRQYGTSRKEAGASENDTIAKMLNVRQPSVVQMLKRLNEAKL